MIAVMAEETLKQNDLFLNGTKEQYSQIVKLVLGKNYDKGLLQFMVENCLIRGGLFWSERIENVVPGKLQNGNQYSFKEYFTRLKNTLKD